MPDETRRQRASKRLFNSKHRLDVALALLELRDGIFDLETAATTVGIAKSTVHGEMALLVELGILERHDPVAGGRTVYYTVIDPQHPFWALARVEDHRLADDVAAQQTGSVP